MTTITEMRRVASRRIRRAWILVLAPSLVLALCAARGARAADTWETYDVGFTELELYTGLDGVGLQGADRSMWLEGLMGWGFVDGFSGYLITGASADGSFGHRTGEVYLGVFGTPLDTDHVDLDLMLEYGIYSGGMQLMPALELNLDIEPDQALAGFYILLSHPLCLDGGWMPDDLRTPRFDESGESWSRWHGLGITTGAYVTLAEVHQLLLEYDMGIATGPTYGEGRVDVGGLALGWNASLNDVVELITEISVDLPQKGEKPSAGFMIGLIVIPPSPAGEG